MAGKDLSRGGAGFTHPVGGSAPGGGPGEGSEGLRFEVVLLEEPAEFAAVFLGRLCGVRHVPLGALPPPPMVQDSA